MSIKVLVADDSITIQKVIGIIFGGDEYSLTVVDNGKAAVDKAREINPDILLIDALMPGMTGYEVAETVRSTPSLATKPILILTGSFEPFDEEKAKKCGADDFIAKPFESQQIITKVKELLELGNARTLTAQASQQQHVTETAFEPVSDKSAPVVDIPSPTFAPQPEVPQPEAPSDIWGAFTVEEEPKSSVVVPPVSTVSSSALLEPDVFALVTEENDAQLIQTSAPVDTQPHHTGSQWVPVEENTFEFEEEAVTESVISNVSHQEVPVQETSFGDISFDNDIATPSVPVITAVPESDFTEPAPEFSDFSVASAAMEELPTFEEVPVFEEMTAFEESPTLESVPVVENAFSAAAPSAAPLTEDQLKAAIMASSKEVIERIVWEVVPDLAETLIREAIRKIKEGA